jgi:hypothetical protein
MEDAMERINTRAARKSARQSVLELIEEMEMEQPSFILSEETSVQVFQRMVDSGDAWSMQGHYGAMAAALIDAGLVRTN